MLSLLRLVALALLLLSLAADAELIGRESAEKFASDPSASLRRHEARKQANAKERRHGVSFGSPIPCPFLKTIVPVLESAKWQPTAEKFVAALKTMDAEGFSHEFFSDSDQNGVASLTVYPVGNSSATAARLVGQDAIGEYFAKEFRSMQEIRLTGFYPDVQRGMALMTLEAFHRCPRTGELYSVDWGLERVRTREFSLWKRLGHRSGTTQVEGVAVPHSLASNVSIALGQAVSSLNCTAFVELLEDDVEIQLADAFFHKRDDAMFEMAHYATTIAGMDKAMRYCKSWVAHQAKIAPLEFLDVAKTFQGGASSAVMIGSLAIRVIYSPKVVDWVGAVRVTASSAGKISFMKVYPLEATHMLDRWSWKYGHGRQPVNMLATFFGFLLFFVAIVGVCCFCCYRCCCAKSRVAARDIEVPLQAAPYQATPFHLAPHHQAVTAGPLSATPLQALSLPSAPTGGPLQAVPLQAVASHGSASLA